jgi:putative DNA primase/helicase
MQELPGILNWAIEGWKRLRARGHFVMPHSCAEAMRELEELSSPVQAFVRDTCLLTPGARVDVDDLYAAWKLWCEL